VEHFTRCIKIDNKHPYAYNNLAFIFNMHLKYKDTIKICEEAKKFNFANHNTHRHWAFAEFKDGNLVRAIKKIRKGVHKQPNNADNWVVWGLILRTAGKYKSAEHKFRKALEMDPANETAKYELAIVKSLIHYDKILPTDATLNMK